MQPTRDAIMIVCATRFCKQEFWEHSLLGKSLRKLSTSLEGVKLNVFFENKEGLSCIYNRAIRSCAGTPTILVFLHDDVYIYDIMFVERVRDAMRHCDIAGVAGTSTRYPNQPGWCFSQYNPAIEKCALTNPNAIHGTVAHGDSDKFEVSYFGPPTNHAKLLDGLMLVAHSSRLIEKNVYFDEQFNFHFYDMDFCREAEKKGLRMAVVGISVIHRSAGNFCSPAWNAAHELYIDKWENKSTNM